MALTDVQIRKAIPSDKQYKLTDSGGLSLLVRPTGTKSWICKLTIHGKEQRLTFGTYPQMTLKEARSRRDEVKLEMMRGGNPIQRRRDEKLAAQLSAGNLFEDIAEEFIAKREAEEVAPATLKKLHWYLELLRKGIGKRPIAEIKPQELLATLKKIERKGYRESAKRARSFASQVFRYGVMTGRCDAEVFDEVWFKWLVAKAIIFRSLEKLVPQQPWYAGGYRANIVTYAFSKVVHDAQLRKRVLDLDQVWRLQRVPAMLERALTFAAEAARLRHWDGSG
ncbi:hypothetical protein ABIE62_002291 [Porphyrobacter sp. MBR-155]|jgi:hypothetical protein|uniref:AIPR family protein n=1 Tax=Porphyrobacter sp. MBR-155 TaxID=3156464 RepID=UPI003394E2B0